ncbi:peptide transporter periplasmic-binding protein [Escherichia coli]|nr:peptide transporter periplasmic-binding protein [Escherichia coli]
MDAGQRAAEVEGKGQKESGVRCSTLAGRLQPAKLTGHYRRCLPRKTGHPTLFNTAFYSNKQVDDFLAQALKTNDPAEKTRLYKAAQGYHLARVAVDPAGGRKTGVGTQ